MRTRRKQMCGHDMAVHKHVCAREVTGIHRRAHIQPGARELPRPTRRPRPRHRRRATGSPGSSGNHRTRRPIHRQRFVLARHLPAYGGS
jgi:hypothetical protein